ncbi:glucan endo-1,3-beta-glucosidase 11-like [Andrographis paniculata]|uniref:glucan endo-1,3-beta-glucosidase 11-like n=1 Tax=Andrographis paniculata TaxID=175694 RepID=UPI0021E6EBD1|nr:glucan endo-1,3-beta-glucosidase 11-like [Andrographis paniculata]
MRAFRFLLLVFLSGLHASVAVAFTGTYGINYGRIANNIPAPDKVVTLLKQAKIKNVRIYDADHSVLNAFKGTGLELVVGLPNGNVKDVSASADHAMTWVKDNVKAFLPDTQIVGIAVGNEVLAGSDYELSTALLGAVKNIHNATKSLGIDKVIQITTSHSQAVFANSFPPSSCIFKEGVAQLMKPLLETFAEMGSPFCLNAYPFLAYTYDPVTIDINYALFQPNSGVYDQKTDLHYDNMLDAQIDAAYAALENAGFKKMEVIITETGWASHGDQGEPAATPGNAKTYHHNLRKRLALKKGTPFRPKHVLKAYIFALFNENSKPGAGSEKYYGLFNADGTISYDIGFSGLKSSSASASRISFTNLRGRGWCAASGSLISTALAPLLFLLLIR